MIFPVLYPSIFLLLYERVRVRVVVILLFFGLAQQETSIWYHMIRNTVFVVFRGTLLPTAGAVVLIRKSTTLQDVPWLCASIQEESCAISPRMVIHRDICREHSLIRRRNCLMTEAANSLSAAAGQELSTTRNPIPNRQ